DVEDSAQNISKNLNSLQKLSRTAYKSQSTLSVPEEQRLTFNRYNSAVKLLEDQNGIKPTLHDVADYLAIKPKKLQTIVENVQRKEFMESGEGPGFVHHDESDVIDLAYGDMTPLQRQIFELRTGYNNTPVAKDAKEIADRFKEGNPVIINVQSTDQKTMRRIIDFASGVCYANNGTMEKMSNGVFMMKPFGARVTRG
ncbi:MAG: DUF552 domain-containing protein, partial [Actinobacteria bacterium]|nr:DUF552 domain-containing protein [Actinomycetota bacterium]